MASSRSLTVWEGRSVLEWRALWRVPQLRIMASTGSTNDDVRVLGEASAPSGTVVMAESQTAGRGRRGRTWVGAPGRSLQLSMLVHASESGFSCLTAAPVRVGLIAQRAISAETGLPVQLKWPNDLLVQNHKLGGILCESVLGRQPFLVIGIGINVGQQHDDFPAELRMHATSIALAHGKHADRARIASALVKELLAHSDHIADRLSTPELEALLGCDALRGREVEIDGRPAGTAVGIDQDGALLLRTALGVSAVHRGTVAIP
jgi:BirA family biotin operon repressor/biotin-[acetyl-CoA-carboxylase] ligase